MIIFNILITSFILWLLFLPAAFLLKMKQRGEIDTTAKKIGFTLYASIFLPLDVFYNYTVGTVIFGFQLPPPYSWTLTQRLTYYLRNEPNTWRGKFAYYICAYLIEPHHPGHCGLAD